MRPRVSYSECWLAARRQQTWPKPRAATANKVFCGYSMKSYTQALPSQDGGWLHGLQNRSICRPIPHCRPVGRHALCRRRQRLSAGASMLSNQKTEVRGQQKATGLQLTWSFFEGSITLAPEQGRLHRMPCH